MDDIIYDSTQGANLTAYDSLDNLICLGMKYVDKHVIGIQDPIFKTVSNDVYIICVPKGTLSFLIHERVK